MPTSKRKYTIYAVDFDGTLCESMWPGIGSPNILLINHLIERREQGNKIILWTCRCGKRLKDAITWCKIYGLEFDAVNENLPEMIKKYGNDSRKIFYDVLIDDKAINKPKYHVPYKEARKKQIPKKPIEYEDKYYGCPICDNVLMFKYENYPTHLKDKKNGLPYCLSCGQAIDWRDDD